MGSTKAKWRNNILTYYDGTTYETTKPLAPFVFYDDFEGGVIQTTAAGVKGWTVIDTGAATEAIVANGACGVLSLNLTNANEKQEAGITMGNTKNFWLDNGPIFEARVAVHTAPAGQAELYFGLAGDYVEGPIAEADAGPLIHAFFCFDGSLVCRIFTDDNSTDNDAVATGTTVVADAYHIFRIDFTDPADVKFYIDGQNVATTTTFDMSNGTNIPVQPFFMAHKEADPTTVGAGSLYIDYVRVWQATRYSP